MTVIKIRIDFEGDRYIGHGRIELLELIGRHGSIARAAKAMEMSYKRAWYLIDEFNGMFSEPLIERHHGGKGGGAGATVGGWLVRGTNLIARVSLGFPSLGSWKGTASRTLGIQPKSPSACSRNDSANAIQMVGIVRRS